MKILTLAVLVKLCFYYYILETNLAESVRAVTYVTDEKDLLLKDLSSM